MPRIEAATVAEHRAARERALLDAAATLLKAEPERLPSLAEVGELAGLSRSSVYVYFASRDDLLQALLRDSFPRWQDTVDRAVAAAGSPSERVLAFVRANLQLVADGEHALAQALSIVVPSEDLERRSREFHDMLLAPVVDALVELGHDDVETLSVLINGLVHAASRLVEQRGDVERAYRATADILGAYLRVLERDEGKAATH